MEKTNVSLVLPDCSVEVEWEKLCLPNKTSANMKSIKVILSPTEMSWYQNWDFLHVSSRSHQLPFQMMIWM